MHRRGVLRPLKKEEFIPCCIRKMKKRRCKPAFLPIQPANTAARPSGLGTPGLDAEELKRQIDVMKKMGLGGFHMHVRSGMATPYLSPEFMKLIHTCVDKARENHMLAWLYDEDRWPSGAAGGIVTRDKAYRSRYLLFTPIPYGQGNTNAETDASARASRQENGILLARYRVTLKDGLLTGYELLDPDEPDEPGLWYAYRETQGENPWYNNQAYLDTLNPKAVQRFIEVTHEAYAREVGEDFGGLVPASLPTNPSSPARARWASPKPRKTSPCPIPTTSPKPTAPPMARISLPRCRS